MFEKDKTLKNANDVKNADNIKNAKNADAEGQKSVGDFALNSDSLHVAIIMDGNGRWATSRGKDRSFGHKKGAEIVSDIVDAAFSSGVYALSLYALSCENLSRPNGEVKKLVELLDRGIIKEGERAKKNGVRFIVSGDKNILNDKSLKKINELEAQTADCGLHVLNLCFNYGSRQELCRAAEKIIASGEKQVTPELMQKYLYTADIPDVDLVIRTGGEKRLSNFLLWQSSYAELYFTDTLWPDFTADEFKSALDWFSSRKRRFGKV